MHDNNVSSLGRKSVSENVGYTESNYRIEPKNATGANRYDKNELNGYFSEWLSTHTP